MDKLEKQKYKLHLREEMRPDFTIDQRYEAYEEDDHALWRELYQQQVKLLQNRACKEYLEGLDKLDMSGGVPKFDDLNRHLKKATGWEIVAVTGAVPASIFFQHLANRRFPATDWMRAREDRDYIEEPDVFHDVFGHVPLLLNPVFADYMQAYGMGGVRSQEFKAGKKLGRLYWYTVEFGLIRTQEGLRIYGAGIVSSKTESIYALESPLPHRTGFDLKRMMQTDFDITKLQDHYFVIDSFEQLFAATQQDFAPIYEELQQSDVWTPRDLVPGDVVLHHGAF